MSNRVESLSHKIYRRLGDEWFVSTPAKRIFSFAFVLTIATIVLSLWPVVSPGRGPSIPPPPALLRILLTILYILGPAGSLVLFFGMLRYWVRIDTAPKHQKTAWFLVLVLGTLLGACLYYDFVYSPKISSEGGKQMKNARKLLRVIWAIVFLSFVIFAVISKILGHTYMMPAILRTIVVLGVALIALTLFVEARDLFRAGVRARKRDEP